MNIKPIAKLHKESDGFAISIHPERDPDNFIVVYRFKNESEAQMMLHSLNSILEDCIRERMFLFLTGNYPENNDELHLDSLKLDPPEEGGMKISFTIGEPLSFRGEEES